MSLFFGCKNTYKKKKKEKNREQDVYIDEYQENQHNQILPTDLFSCRIHKSDIAKPPWKIILGNILYRTNDLLWFVYKIDG